MKTAIALSAALFCLLLVSPHVQAVQLDVSSGGVEVTGPAEITIHNGLLGSDYFYGVFRWNSRKNIWEPTDHGLEPFTFRTSEYFPLDQGKSWTYALSVGGTSEP
jgi:hypothetical protein